MRIAAALIPDQLLCSGTLDVHLRPDWLSMGYAYTFVEDVPLSSPVRRPCRCVLVKGTCHEHEMEFAQT